MHAGARVGFRILEVHGVLSDVPPAQIEHFTAAASGARSVEFLCVAGARLSSVSRRKTASMLSPLAGILARSSMSSSPSTLP